MTGRWDDWAFGFLHLAIDKFVLVLGRSITGQQLPTLAVGGIFPLHPIVFRRFHVHVNHVR